MKFTGKPQKKSIRSFFYPLPAVPPDTPKSASSSTAAPVTNDAHAVLSSNVIASEALRETTPPATQSPSTLLRPSTVSSASIDATSLDYDVPPPIASQTSANSGGSKRVVSKGEDVVLNSDSDTESLKSLDWGEPKKTTKISTSIPRPKRIADEGEDALHRPQKQRKSGKRSLIAVVETVQQNLELEQRIQEHKADLDKSLEEPITTRIAINEQTLGQVVESDDEEPGKAHRLFQAMQRTNTTQSHDSFYFFDEPSKSAQLRSPFPVEALSAHRWISHFTDPIRREQAFLTGFAHQIFQLQRLPEELASWMIDEICQNSNEVLHTRYLDLLESHPKHLQKLLDQSRLDTIFRALGASLDMLSSAAAPVNMVRQPTTKQPLPPSLKPVTRLLERAASRLRSKTRSRALHLLYHVCLDDRVITDADILCTIQDAIEVVTNNFADNSKLTSGLGEIIPQMLSRVIHPALQKNLISALPSKSPMTSYLRRHLALCFFLYPKSVDVPLADPKVPGWIHKHLDNSSDFQVDKETNYSSLTARLELLDVAIGPGPLSVPYQPLVSPALSQAGSSPIMAPTPVSSEVKDFNKEVDALARHVKFLGNSIVEAGAVTDLTILEAKDCVERLCARLEHAVRIGGKKVHDPFAIEKEGSQLKMSTFVTKRSKTLTPALSNGIFD